MYCRSCGEELDDKAVACTKCGRRPQDGKKFCHSCGKETPEDAVICTACGVSLGPAGARLGEKSPIVAGLLNWVWSGAGTIYLGQMTKGIVLCCVTLFLVIIDVVTCSIGLILHIPYAVAMIIDAVLIANRLNKGETVSEWKFF